jgi:replicative DNA helicase
VNELPPFPLDAFPPRLHLFCEAVAQHTQTPPELAACAMLGALSSAALGIKVDAGEWREELALFLLVVMGPANRKSSVMEIVIGPLRELERERRSQMKDDVAHARSRKEGAEQRRRQLLGAYAKAQDAAERAVAMDDIAEVDRELADIGEPHPFRLLASDATAEALAGLLSTHGKIAILASEGAFLDNLVGGRYSEGSANLHLTLQAYAGEPFTIDRRGRGAEEIERPLLTVTLAVQDHYLPQLIEHPVARGQGLVSRFMFVTPVSRVGRRSIRTDPVPAELSDDWLGALERIQTLSNPYMPFAVNATNGSRRVSGIKSNKSLIRKSDPFPLLSFSPDAKLILDTMRDMLEPDLAPQGQLGHIADWANRQPGRLVRIAGLLHLAAGHGPEELISDETTAKAWRVVDFLMEHGRAALEQPDATMRRAFVVINQWEAETISVRELRRHVLHSKTEPGAAEKLAASLVESGHLIPVLEAAGEPRPGRPASPRYTIVKRQEEQTDEARVA